ncbi:Adenylate kinase 2 [Spironucleus salmonicida]|uniref:Adenylate kinase 2 n=1 Tax=Spironucleus salmonicida TaxID=348837 RepID=K7REM3_9EUKA|nr:adenylate kinase 2 [Spironucleus salmonicida]KAH0570697.1 Adenylate kinase 2 [Spironucleus salmonicida]|eukprot:EST47494.1 Adenylate kinase 2 [Spironucleus salmonicida]
MSLDASLQTYLDQHQIYSQLQTSLEEMVRVLPPSPVDFLADFFAKIPKSSESTRETKRVVLLGPPGCGKGTQAKHLQQNYNLHQISPGNLLRAEISQKSALGMQAKEFMDAGKLVPDSIVIELISNYTKTLSKSQGWFFDGFPRTELQAYALKADKSLIPTHVIEFVVNQEEVISRIGGRRFDPITSVTYHITNDPPPAGEVASRCIIRDDDKEQVVKDRFRVYNSSLQGIREVFGHQLTIINVNGLGIKDVAVLLDNILNAPPQIKNPQTREIIPRGPGIVNGEQEQQDWNIATANNDRPKIEEIE